MTTSSVINRVVTVGNGSTTAFPFPYPFHAKADLIVKTTVITTGAETLKVLTTHYLITGTLDGQGHYANGGTVTFLVAPPSTVRVTIYRDPTLTQGLDLADARSFSAESTEAQLDYLTMLVQRLSERVDRCVRIPEGDTDNLDLLPPKVTRASKYLAFDSSGNPGVAAATDGGQLLDVVDTDELPGDGELPDGTMVVEVTGAGTTNLIIYVNGIRVRIQTLVTGYLTDSGIHTPPVSGTYDYQAFTPGAVTFPAVGSTYTDPIFGGIVRRLTNAYSTSQANGEQIYSKHHANADGTYCFSTQWRAGVYTQLFILDTSTGAEVYASQPVGDLNTDIAWHPTDPNLYYFMEGAALKMRNLTGQSTSTIKTFAATLQTLGGSVNWMDKTGRYMVIKYSDEVRVWDSEDDDIYTGEFTQLDVAQWVGITPDGNYLVDVSGATAFPDRENYSRLLDHSANSIGSPVSFWGLAGSHMALVSASNGKNYAVAFESYSTSGIWRVDITLNQAGRTAEQQRSDNQLLIPTTFDSSGHMTGISRGLYSDWCFFDDELTTDDFSDVPAAPWPAYASEVMAVHVLTGEIRRFAHHRSRGMLDSYYYEPRISSSWDGSVLLFTSNFNRDITDYADLYVINNPMGSA